MSQDETLEEIERKNREWLAEMRRKQGCQNKSVDSLARRTLDKQEDCIDTVLTLYSMN